MLRFLTSGESHGQGLVTILEGLPAGLAIDFDADHARAAPPPGRLRPRPAHGDRIRSRGDSCRACAAARRPARRSRCWCATRTGRTGRTRCTSRPQAPAGSTGANRAPVVRPRPGHADLAGALKYDHDDIRDVLERASARETAARVAAGAIARQLLLAVGCEITSHITGIGDVVVPAGAAVVVRCGARARAGSAAALRRYRDRDSR